MDNRPSGLVHTHEPNLGVIMFSPQAPKYHTSEFLCRFCGCTWHDIVSDPTCM